jgi:hypothetical protein
MPWTKVGSAVVVAAQQFNPSVVSQLWLVRNHIVAEADYLSGCLFSDALVSVQSRQFQMLVVPPQLQFVPSVPADAEQDVIVEKLGSIIQSLPHTPYSGLGLNFTWHLVPADGDMPSLSRRLFFRDDQPLFRNFSSPDSQFGGYLSKNALRFRLKLDIKPIAQPGQGEQVEDRIQFAFNFHLGVNENAAQEIIDHLNMWNEADREVQRIIDSVAPRDEA